MTRTREYLDHVNRIVGDERREALITACADRLILNNAMAPHLARRYAEGEWADTGPAILAAPGQVWAAQSSEPDRDIVAALTGTDTSAFTIAHVERVTGMVCNGRGHAISFGWLGTHYRLTEWPADFSATGERPQAPAAPIEPAEHRGDEDKFDPRRMYVNAEAVSDSPADVNSSPFDGHLPILGDGYTVKLLRSRKTGDDWPLVHLDAIAYLTANLADYRDGFWQWHATEWAPVDHQERYFRHFNELGGSEDVDLEVCAYLGRWLWQRIRGDVAREHGGNAADYHVGFMWAAWMGDLIVPEVIGADPREPLPVDHPLAQCDDQAVLFGGQP